MTDVPTTEERLWGLSVTTTAGFRVTFVPRIDDDGAAGVREPRRPKDAPPALSVALEAS